MSAARFVYEQTEDFATVQRLAADGWRLVGVAFAYRDAYTPVTVYVMERLAGGEGR